MAAKVHTSSASWSWAAPEGHDSMAAALCELIDRHRAEMDRAVWLQIAPPELVTEDDRAWLEQYLAKSRCCCDCCG